MLPRASIHDHHLDTRMARDLASHDHGDEFDQVGAVIDFIACAFFASAEPDPDDPKYADDDREFLGAVAAKGGAAIDAAEQAGPQDREHVGAKLSSAATEIGELARRHRRDRATQDARAVGRQTVHVRTRRLDRRMGSGRPPARRTPRSTRAGPDAEDGEPDPPGGGESGGVTSRLAGPNPRFSRPWRPRTEVRFAARFEVAEIVELPQLQLELEPERWAA
jgi:hypothetical protein